MPDPRFHVPSDGYPGPSDDPHDGWSIGPDADDDYGFEEDDEE